MSERLELYRRINDYASEEFLRWPKWKREHVVMYTRSSSLDARNGGLEDIVVCRLHCGNAEDQTDSGRRAFS